MSFCYETTDSLGQTMFGHAELGDRRRTARVVTAFEQMDLKIPIVVRLTGTNEKEGREILGGLTSLHTAETMDDAVKKAIELAG